MSNSKQFKDSFKISIVHAAYWSAYTIIGTFLVSYLSQNHYSTEQVGFIVASSTIISALIQPVWGYLADQKFKLKNITLFLMFIIMPLTLTLPKAVGSFTLITIVNIILVVFERPIAGLLDTITNVASENNVKVIYGISRGMGSLFSAITTLFVGKYLEATKIENVFYIFVILMAIAALSLYLVGNYNFERQESVSKSTFKETFKSLLENKAFMYLLLSNVLLNIGLKAALTYAPIMIKEMGGSVGDSGTAMAINTVGMLPMMAVYSYLAARNKKKSKQNDNLYFAAAMFTIIRIFSMGLVSTVNGMLAIQIINSLSYGFLQPAMISSLSEVVTMQDRASAIAIMSSSILIIASLFGDFLAGRIIKIIGTSNLFYIFTIIAVVGMLMYIPFVKYRNEMERIK